MKQPHAKSADTSVSWGGSTSMRETSTPLSFVLIRVIRWLLLIRDDSRDSWAYLFHRVTS